jgi:predicted AAA+ superfamily ATPase
MKRVYEMLLGEHIEQERQMAFLTGPRQVGKTTTARTSAGSHRYFTWDRQADRMIITKGPDAAASNLELSTLKEPVHIVYDELHKYQKWKSFLKGFFDVYGGDTRIVVTGSARLGFFRRGGDSLMGRYFLYRMHPLTLSEVSGPATLQREIGPPKRPQRETLDRLIRFGGFPEPFLRDSARFYNRWKRLRLELLFREDLRDLTRIQEAGQVQVLAETLSHWVGRLLNYSSLAAEVNVSIDTVRRWLAALEALFFCFTVRPWHRNVPKSLRKQPKVYLWDWSTVPDSGSRLENLVASHLLKAAHGWTDSGLGEYDLFFVRDKAKREVDFLVTRNGKPWLLVEAKSGDRTLSPSLAYFHRCLGTTHALQVASDLEYVDRDCFEANRPIRAPLTTFLSQLV